MAASFSITDDNDIGLDDYGNIKIVTGDDAILCCCNAAIRAVKGEMVFEVDRGVAYEETLFDRRDLVLFESSCRENLRRVDGVKAVKSFTASITGNTVYYTATIVTENDTEVTLGNI